MERYVELEPLSPAARFLAREALESGAAARTAGLALASVGLIVVFAVDGPGWALFLAFVSLLVVPVFFDTMVDVTAKRRWCFTVADRVDVDWVMSRVNAGWRSLPSRARGEMLPLLRECQDIARIDAPGTVSELRTRLGVLGGVHTAELERDRPTERFSRNHGGDWMADG